MGVDSSRDGEDGEEEERPVCDVRLQHLEDVSPALRGEADSDEAATEYHHQRHQRLESDESWPLAADGVADHLHVTKDVGDAHHDDEKREEGGPEPAEVDGGEGLQHEDNVAQPDTVAKY